MIMDRAYEGDETRQLLLCLEMQPVVPPKINRLNPWEYDRELYKKRNEVERLFRRLKAFRRIFSRFEKLDLMFIAFIHVALICDALFYLTRGSMDEANRAATAEKIGREIELLRAKLKTDRNISQKSQNPGPAKGEEEKKNGNATMPKV